MMMPAARKMLAVPFVALEVPSRSSEFAHPEVLIGPFFAYSLWCTHSPRAGIEWRHCHRAVGMARPHEEPHHSGRACA